MPDTVICGIFVRYYGFIMSWTFLVKTFVAIVGWFVVLELYPYISGIVDGSYCLGLLGYGYYFFIGAFMHWKGTSLT